jgi:hypothetical protein
MVLILGRLPLHEAFEQPANTLRREQAIRELPRPGLLTRKSRDRGLWARLAMRSMVAIYPCVGPGADLGTVRFTDALRSEA